MRVAQLGTGTPEVAIVGAVHGDEPAGVTAIERLLSDDPPVERPVKLVVANEEALERGVRYVDADLNRAFADDVPADAHERRLAERLADELDGCTVLSIHSTQSSAEPFALVSGTDGPAAAICPFLSIAALVDLDVTYEGRLFAVVADLIEIESGYQGSAEAAENAYRIAREFLTATDVLPGRTVGRDLPVFRLRGPIDKPAAGPYRVLVENFTRVEAGQPFAEADGNTLTAERPFYPVLLSAYGYEDIFGYVGDRIGVLEAPPRERTS